MPTFMAEAVEAHLARIYSREVHRDGPERLVKWWRNVDGRCATIDQWMSGTIAPLLLVLGQLDIIIDHPPAPQGEVVRNRADEVRLGLDACVASYILPENMIWWTLDRLGRYSECLVREVQDDAAVRWRFWNAHSWVLYDQSGKVVAGPVEHPFGRVPIVRVFDRRRPRLRNIGLPRYESIAELPARVLQPRQRADSLGHDPGPPALARARRLRSGRRHRPIGPNWLLPKKKNASGATATYEGFDVVQFPKDGAESIRLNKADLRDAADRAAILLKPAGEPEPRARRSGQSGIAKRLDQAAGNDLLSKIAAMLGRTEEQIAELALVVLDDGVHRDQSPVVVHYPTEFDLFTADELARAIVQFQGILADAGNAPRTESELLRKLIRLMLPGLEDAEYAEFEAEIDGYLETPPARTAAPSWGRMRLPYRSESMSDQIHSQQMNPASPSFAAALSLRPSHPGRPSRPHGTLRLRRRFLCRSRSISGSGRWRSSSTTSRGSSNLHSTPRKPSGFACWRRRDRSRKPWPSSGPPGSRSMPRC